MAKAQTKDFEVFETITANGAGAVKTIDLNTFVNVADMEAFGVEAIEVGINATELTPETSIFFCQVALQDLSAGFINHADYDSIYLNYTDVLKGFKEDSLSLGDVAQIRYLPGGQLQVRADRMSGLSDTDLYVRITGRISKLSAADYMALALTNSLN
ncbi:MAG: hypothetical protein [Circular genetic element sp.]|nr:MAG: hypothetical protein [Circular genetic element sp.]